MLKLFKSKSKIGHPRILVIDDEPDLVSTIQCRLNWYKCKVSSAVNGQEGLEKAAEEKPDLILLDNNMPIMSGPEMLQRLRQDPSLQDIPVIMVTALCEAADIERVSAYNIADYVTKPFNYTELIEKITSILDNKTRK